MRIRWCEERLDVSDVDDPFLEDCPPTLKNKNEEVTAATHRRWRRRATSTTTAAELLYFAREVPFAAASLLGQLAGANDSSDSSGGSGGNKATSGLGGSGLGGGGIGLRDVVGCSLGPALAMRYLLPPLMRALSLTTTKAVAAVTTLLQATKCSW